MKQRLLLGGDDVCKYTAFAEKGLLPHMIASCLRITRETLSHVCGQIVIRKECNIDQC